MNVNCLDCSLYKFSPRFLPEDFVVSFVDNYLNSLDVFNLMNLNKEWWSLVNKENVLYCKKIVPLKCIYLAKQNLENLSNNKNPQYLEIIEALTHLDVNYALEVASKLSHNQRSDALVKIAFTTVEEGDLILSKQIVKQFIEYFQDYAGNVFISFLASEEAKRGLHSAFETLELISETDVKKFALETVNLNLALQNPCLENLSCVDKEYHDLLRVEIIKNLISNDKLSEANQIFKDIIDPYKKVVAQVEIAKKNLNKDFSLAKNIVKEIILPTTRCKAYLLIAEHESNHSTVEAKQNIVTENDINLQSAMYLNIIKFETSYDSNTALETLKKVTDLKTTTRLFLDQCYFEVIKCLCKTNLVEANEIINEITDLQCKMQAKMMLYLYKSDRDFNEAIKIALKEPSIEKRIWNLTKIAKIVRSFKI